MKLNPSTNHLFLAHQDSNTVSVINTITNGLVKTLDVGLGPISIDINPVTNRVYVANHGSNSITIIQDGFDQTPSPTATATATPSPEVSFTPTTTPSPGPKVSPTPTQPGSTITINPATGKSSLIFKTAIVTVTDNNGDGISSVMVRAKANGLMANVKPKITKTDINGNAKFKFRFGFVSKDGRITFTVDGLSTSIVQE